MKFIHLMLRTTTVALAVAGGLCACDSVDHAAQPALPGSLTLQAPARAEVGQAVSLASSIEADLNGLRFNWDFGDGSSSDQPRPSHAYANAGRFEVRLTVRNASGDSRSASTAIVAGRFARLQGLECGASDGSGWCWQRPLPRGNRLLDAAFVDARLGWSVGEAGLILHTQDVGGHWTAQRSGTSYTLRQVRFLDAHIGYAAGDGGVLLTSSTGGR